MKRKYRDIKGRERGGGWPSTARYVWERDGGLCVYCGGFAQVLDHVIRNADNAPTISSNLVCCCNRCNAFRGRHPDDMDTLTRAIFWLLSHGEDTTWMDEFYK